jgi:hypothetical protein
LKQNYETLTAEQRGWITGIARDAQHAGRPLHLGDNPTARRYELVRGLVALAGAGYDEDEIVRALADAVRCINTMAAIGSKLSTFTADEAKRFADLCAAYSAGTVTSTIADDGRLVFT